MSNYIKRQGEVIASEFRVTISKRYHKITSAINKEFRKINSDTLNSFYVGSYGRGSAVNTSDIDILVVLPEEEYYHYDAIKSNGQSRLLQAVRQALLVSYPTSEIRADGQIVKINFKDGIKFEILPAFKKIDLFGTWDGTYRYPDSNSGGRWYSTNPKAEQEAMKYKNNTSNGLLLDTCKHLRFVRDNNFRSYYLSGIVIDSFVYEAIGNWRWLTQGESSTSERGTYEKHLLEYLNNNSIWGELYLRAPGSGDKVDTSKSIECLKKVLEYIAY